MEGYNCSAHADAIEKPPDGFRNNRQKTLGLISGFLVKLLSTKPACVGQTAVGVDIDQSEQGFVCVLVLF